MGVIPVSCVFIKASEKQGRAELSWPPYGGRST